MQLNLSFLQFEQVLNESETLRRFVWSEMGGAKSIFDFIDKVKSNFPEWRENKIGAIKEIRTLSMDRSYRNGLLAFDKNAFNADGGYCGLVFAKELYENKF